MLSPSYSALMAGQQRVLQSSTAEDCGSTTTATFMGIPNEVCIYSFYACFKEETSGGLWVKGSAAITPLKFKSSICNFILIKLTW